ncbi:MAG: DUF192 domain-containing protein [Acidobacteria bacterium]|nr:DUF192 domain-containing protein [Acidobacteriota bacterium]
MQTTATKRGKVGSTYDLPKIRVRNLTRGTTLAEAATVANTSETRRTGLLKHERLDPGEGLWIVPCEGVHTFRMKFDIDVVYLSKSKKVLKVRARMPKSRISFCLRAHSVLELPAGMTESTATEAGDQLEFEKLT